MPDLSASTRNPLRIVVDSALFRLMIRDVLSELPGCEVVGKAANGRTALSVIEKLKPDLVTLDVEMPEMNGIETLRTQAAKLRVANRDGQPPYFGRRRSDNRSVDGRSVRLRAQTVRRQFNANS